MDQLDLEGNWHLPNRSDDLISGKLLFINNSYQLEITINYKQLEYLHSQEILVGKSFEGNLFTLINLNVIKWVHSFGGQYKVIYKVQYIIKDVKFDTIEEVAFDGISFHLSTIDNWINRPGITPEYGVDNYGDGTSFKYKRPESINFQLADNLEGIIDFRINANYSNMEAKLSQKAFVQIKTIDKSSIPFLGLIDALIKFGSFLTVCGYSHCFPTYITFSNKHIQQERLIKKIPEIFFKVFCHVEKLPLSREATNFLIPFSIIAGDFSNIISKWFRLNDELNPSMTMLRHSFLVTRFSHNDFLNIVQAIENFHRKTSDNNIASVDLDDEASLWTGIFEKLSEDEVLFVKGKTQIFKEPSLRQRLKYLVKEFNSDFINSLIVDERKFISVTVEVRNYYTHYDRESPKHADYDRLYYITDKLRLILLFAILTKIGISSTTVTQLLWAAKPKLLNYLFPSQESTVVTSEK